MLLGRARNPLAYTNKIKALGPIAYWPQAEPSGTTIGDESGNGRSGTYVGVTLGQPGIGDGRTAAGYAGATSYGNIYSASLSNAIAFDGACAAWIKMSAVGIWTDGVIRRALRIQDTAGTNIIGILKISNNTLRVEYTANGSVSNRDIGGQTTTGWLHIAATWSDTGNTLELFLNGVSRGTSASSGTWNGTLDSSKSVIGAQNTGAGNPWSGFIAHLALWNRALSAAEIASLAVVP